jgi:trehalose/maltose hydrolase-like predicted phosphorylase
LDRRFEAIVFDWDGTAVPDRRADAGQVRRLTEQLCAAGIDIAVVSGTHVENVDGQLGARPVGPGLLHLLLNRGSEVYRVGQGGPELVERREASPSEDTALTRAAELAVERLAARGLEVKIVSRRLNRRKIDLIPEPRWADPPKAEIAQLLGAVETRLAAHGVAGLAEAVAIAKQASVEAGLEYARVTSDAKHVEIGLTDKADSARWIFADLWRRGVGPGLVLVAGDEMGPLGGVPGSDSLLLALEADRATAVSVGAEPGGVPSRVIHLAGGPRSFRRLLTAQIDLRRSGAVPEIDHDPRWTLEIDGVDPERERAVESLLAIADGRIGTRASTVLRNRFSNPGVIAAGAYSGDGPEADLLPAPTWHELRNSLPKEARVRRLLDLRTGVLRQEITSPGGSLEAALFSSRHDPGTAAMRTVCRGITVGRGPPLWPARGRLRAATKDGRSVWSAAAIPGALAAAATERRATTGEETHIERFAAYLHDPDATTADVENRVLERLGSAEREGVDRLLVRHRTAWAERWEDAQVDIPDDPDLEEAARFALFHLLASVADSGEAAVGARGLTGPAYRGHVFWDADVFVLPVLAATDPAAARAMLEYRIRRLPAALAEARGAGQEGAHFPWESAGTGAEAAPRVVRDRSGRFVGVHTGQLEEHIVADIAWAACCYAKWTGDRALLEGPARGLLVETARWWTSRIELDEGGRGHIRGVIGPDEYHEAVDDNAYTNVMARWNLRQAAELVPDGDERRRWLALADALVDNYDSGSQLYEQFAGFFELEPLVVAQFAPQRPISATMLLGAERVARAQVVKQADVLMLHHIVPEAVAPDSLAPNLDFYEPRTAHGSSLSPGIHASLLARAGRIGQAYELLRIAARIDLDDITGTTAGGLHLASMASVWHALVLGFGGIRPGFDALEVDPRLPSEWGSFEVRLRFRGSRVRIRIEPGDVTVWADPHIPVRIEGAAPAEADPLGLQVTTKGGRQR